MSDYKKVEQVNYPYLTKPVNIYRNSKGHSVVIAHKEGNMTNIATWVKTGSINENSKNSGVSHFLEHLMFKGTTKYPAGVFDKTLETKGGIINAATWKDYTYYYVTIPKINFDLALHMHADMMVDPLLTEEEIGEAFEFGKVEPKDKRERCVVLEEIRMGQDSNFRKVYYKLNEIMYDNHPYKRNVIGTSEIIASIPQEEIKRYYQTFYTPENLTTVVVGDFNDEEILNKIEKEFIFKDFSSIKKCEMDPQIIEPKNTKETYFEQFGDTNTAYIMMGFLCDSAKNLKENVALDLISVIFGEGKSSRLHRKFIEETKEPYVFQIDTSHYSLKDGDNFFIEALFNHKHKDELINEIKAEIKNLYNISDEELKKAKKNVKTNFAQETETVSDISDSIGYYMSVCEDLALAEKYVEYLDVIDKDFLYQTIEKYLDPNACSISVLLPKEND